MEPLSTQGMIKILRHCISLQKVGEQGWLTVKTQPKIENRSRFMNYDHFRVTMILIKQDPSIINDEDDCSNTPLHLAALHGHIKVVELLLNQGAAIDARYTRPLCTTCFAIFKFSFKYFYLLSSFFFFVLRFTLSGLYRLLLCNRIIFFCGFCGQSHNSSE